MTISAAAVAASTQVMVLPSYELPKNRTAPRSRLPGFSFLSTALPAGLPVAVLLVGATLGLLAAPSFALAGGYEPLDLPPWSVLPFVVLLLCIAVLPLAAGHFWHNDRNKAIVVGLLAVPVILYLAILQLTTGRHTLYPLAHELGKYASFIILLGSLYIVAGGIVVRGDLRPTPLNNAVLLAVGALLASAIGTTGSSVLLIRPFLRINGGRKNKVHLPVFFIFLVGNIGGCLTPLGDPPLFMGYLNGVPFTWTLGLWPEYLFALGSVLAVFFLWDALAFRGERSVPAAPTKPEPIHLEGKLNLLLLAGILGAVLVESDWFPAPIDHLWKLFGSELLMSALACLSWRYTPRALRTANGFTWAPIAEVAILFAGIFVTMVPALGLLETHGRRLGLVEPWQFFWVTGLLSSVLDNAPTYLALATLATGSNEFNLLVENRVAGLDGPLVLRALSCGAVFMGALTYIGNGPNFMVKAIAEEAGYRPPSFFGYILYAGLILVPIYLLMTLFFFLPG